MNGPASPILVLVPTGTLIGSTMERDLARDGFRVERVADAKALLASARERVPAALVVAEPWPGGWARQWKRDPRLERVPIVAVATGVLSRIPPLPFGALVRPDVRVEASALGRSEAIGEAVRAALARGPRPGATRRERVGERLWLVGSAAVLVGLALAMWHIVAFALAGGPPGHLRLMHLGVMSWLAGRVLSDVGSRLGRGGKWRLGLLDGVWLLLLGITVAFVFAGAP